MGKREIKPKWYERALVISAQGVFCTAYFATYVLSPKLAHRIVGYLEEEAIYSYTEVLNELDNGRIENVPTPTIAIDYWQLPQDATLRDVVVVVRVDEDHHRDVNHFASISGIGVKGTEVEVVLPDAKSRLELYQSRGSRGFRRLIVVNC